MKYMGSKNRIAKYLIPIISENRNGRTWVEPFVGGCNMIDKIDGNRIGADSNVYLIALLKGIQTGWEPPEFISKEKHKDIMKNKDKYDNKMVGWASTVCTFRSTGGGYCGIYIVKNDIVRNSQTEAINNVKKQAPNLKGIDFQHCDYKKLIIPHNSLIYCDPPYKNTQQYKNVNKFDSVEFWQWCRDMTNMGHIVYISEYQAPDDFECVWSMKLSSGLSNNTNIEKLFTLKQKSTK